MNIQRFPERAGQVARHLINSHGAPSTSERVEMLNATSDISEAARLLTDMPEGKALAVIARSELHRVADIIAALPTEQAVRFLKATAHDRVTDIFQGMDDKARRAQLFSRLDPATAGAVEHLMTYPRHCAGAMMTTEFVSVTDDFSVADTLAHVRRVEGVSETVYAIYVIDRTHGTLAGVVTLRRLINGTEDAAILTVARREGVVSATPLMPQEQVARLIRSNNLLALPVLDEHGRVLGIVTVDDVIDTMIADTTEDAQK